MEAIMVAAVGVVAKGAGGNWRDHLTIFADWRHGLGQPLPVYMMLRGTRRLQTRLAFGT